MQRHRNAPIGTAGLALFLVFFLSVPIAAQANVRGTVVFVTDPDYDDGLTQTFQFLSSRLDVGVFTRSDGTQLRVARKTAPAGGTR